MVDASVAIKWIVPEEHEQAAEDILLSERSWIAPEFLLVEVGNVLRTKISRGQLNLEQAMQGLALLHSAVDGLIPDRELSDRAFALAVELGHSIYDCMYLGCAERENTQIVTADRRFAEKLERSRFRQHVHLLIA